MKLTSLSCIALACYASAMAVPAYAQTAVGIPHLEKQGSVTQLIVDGKPFLALAGELGNNTASSLENMQPIWSKLRAGNLNCVLAAVSWAQVEPEEGHFEFALVDGLRMIIGSGRDGLVVAGQHRDRGEHGDSRDWRQTPVQRNEQRSRRDYGEEANERENARVAAYFRGNKCAEKIAEAPYGGEEDAAQSEGRAGSQEIGSQAEAPTPPQGDSNQV